MLKGFLDDVNIQFGNLINSIIQDRKSLLINEREAAGKARIDFNKRNIAEIHKDIPSDVARKCPVCGLEMKEHYYLGRHIAKEHPDYAKKEYGEEAKEYLRHPEEHRSEYGGEYSEYSCAICSRFFHTENEIKRHTNTEHSALIKFVHEATQV